MNAKALALAAKAENPTLRFAYHEDSCVGVFSDTLSRFQMCYSRALGIEGWIRTTVEVLINGAPPVADNEWVEV